MKGRYSETEDHEVVWKYRQVICILCDRESKAMGEWNGLWSRSICSCLLTGYEWGTNWKKGLCSDNFEVMALVLSSSVNRRGYIWRCYANNIQAKCKELGWRMAVLVLELRKKSIKDSQACGACTKSWVTKEKLPITWWRNYWWMKRRTGLRGNCVRRTETGQHLWVAVKILTYLLFNFGTLVICLLGLVTVAQYKNYLWLRKLF